MTQRDRDRLTVLKKAQARLIPQRQAALELNLTLRQVQRLIAALRAKGDIAVMHGLRGRPSKRKLSEQTRRQAVAILSEKTYQGFGPTLAQEYLADKHQLRIGREALRQVMISAGLWKASGREAPQTHPWRQRRSCRGELVQWDTSEHPWLEERGPKLYLVAMIDDATSTLLARFVRSDSTEENMRLLKTYLERHGRPVAFYTDRAGLFQTAPKVARDQKALLREEREPLPPTQIGRALDELGIVWIPAYSPQAKGRIERSFGTAQDRLVKGLRVAGARTLEQANSYLEEEFLPWWNQHLVVAPANPADAHRPLDASHDLASALSVVDTRLVQNDYTIRHGGKQYRIQPADVRTGLRGSTVRVELRLDGTMAVRFRGHYVGISECTLPLKPEPKPAETAPATAPVERKPRPKSEWNQSLDLQKGPKIWQAAQASGSRRNQS